MLKKAESPDAPINIIGDVCDALSSLSLPPAGIEKLRTLSRDDFNTISLSVLGLDESLAAMEFCIQLELACGTIVTPEDLVIIHTAGDLFELIEARLYSPHS